MADVHDLIVEVEIIFTDSHSTVHWSEYPAAVTLEAMQSDLVHVTACLTVFECM